MKIRIAWRSLVIAVPALLLVGFLVIPILAIVPMSLNSTMVYSLIPSEPSLVQYRSFFASGSWRSALGNSFEAAAGTAILSVTLGTAAALGIARAPRRYRSVLQAFFVLPQAAPSIVVAVALYFSYSNVGLVGSLLGIVLGHSALALPFVILIVGSAVHNLDPYLADASRSLGASHVRTFLKVTLPQISPGVLGAAVFAFHFSFDEVVIALFLSGPTTKTLPVKVWDGIFYEVSPILPAISSLLILVPVFLFAACMAIAGGHRRFRKRRMNSGRTYTLGQGGELGAAVTTNA